MGRSNCACAVGIKSVATIATKAATFCIRILVLHNELADHYASDRPDDVGLGWPVSDAQVGEGTPTVQKQFLVMRVAQLLLEVRPEGFNLSSRDFPVMGERRGCFGRSKTTQKSHFREPQLTT